MRLTFAIAEENGDFFVWPAQVSSSVWLHCRLIPIDLSWLHPNLLTLASLSKLNLEQLAA